jgi:hypothetical protein
MSPLEPFGLHCWAAYQYQFRQKAELGIRSEHPDRPFGRGDFWERLIDTCYTRHNHLRPFDTEV